LSKIRHSLDKIVKMPKKMTFYPVRACNTEGFPKHLSLQQSTPDNPKQSKQRLA